MIHQILKYSVDAKRIADAQAGNCEIYYALDPCIIVDYLSAPNLSSDADNSQFKKVLFYKAAISMLIEDQTFFFLEPYKLELQDILDHEKREVEKINKYIESNLTSNLCLLRQSFQETLSAEGTTPIENSLPFIGRNFEKLYSLIFYSDIDERLKRYRQFKRNTLNLKIDLNEFQDLENTYFNYFCGERLNHSYANLVDAQALSLLLNVNKDLKRKNANSAVVLISHASIMFRVRNSFQEFNSFSLALGDTSIPLVIHPYSLLLHQFCNESLDDFEKIQGYNKKDLLRTSFESISNDNLKISQIRYFINKINDRASSASKEISKFILDLIHDKPGLKIKVEKIRNNSIEVEHLIADMSDEDIKQARVKNYLIYGIYLFEMEYNRQVREVLEEATLDANLADIQEKLDILKQANVEDAYHLSAYLNCKLEEHDLAKDDIAKGKELCKNNKSAMRKYHYLESINLSNRGRFNDALQLAIENSRKYPGFPRYDLHLGYLYWEQYKRTTKVDLLNHAISLTEAALKRAEAGQESNQEVYCHCILIGLANLIRYYSDAGNLQLARSEVERLNIKIKHYKQLKFISEALPLFHYVTAYIGVQSIEKCEDENEKISICNKIRESIIECYRSIIVVNKGARSEYADLIKRYNAHCVYNRSEK